MNELFDSGNQNQLRDVTRRHFFQQCGIGLGAMAFQSLCQREQQSAIASSTNPMEAKPPHHTPRAKAVIFLFMAGGPSQLDLFTDKP
ncbi:MAG: DUF1501 domain-containing protein, partial [Planctomycetes bacterium]|nr:DUF1501 domain-containing protein [Planctomycetota bacterium]